MKEIYADDFFTIQFDEEIRLFHTSWTDKTENLQEEEIRAIITLFANFLEQTKPTFILSDDSKREFIYGVGMQKWVANTLAMAAINANVTKYGIILPYDFVSSLSTQQTVDEAVDLPFQLSYFEDVESAKKWFLE